jgi:hypothetical protein
MFEYQRTGLSQRVLATVATLATLLPGRADSSKRQGTVQYLGEQPCTHYSIHDETKLMCGIFNHYSTLAYESTLTFRQNSYCIYISAGLLDANSGMK